jgi:hypothetical protein
MAIEGSSFNIPTKTKAGFAQACLDEECSEYGRNEFKSGEIIRFLDTPILQKSEAQDSTDYLKSCWIIVPQSDARINCFKDLKSSMRNQNGVYLRSLALSQSLDHYEIVLGYEVPRTAYEELMIPAQEGHSRVVYAQTISIKIASSGLLHILRKYRLWVSGGFALLFVICIISCFCSKKRERAVSVAESQFITEHIEDRTITMELESNFVRSNASSDAPSLPINRRQLPLKELAYMSQMHRETILRQAGNPPSQTQPDVLPFK